MPGIITKISGPTVVAKGMRKSGMYNLLYVGGMRLIGEVIRIEGDYATIQVYEDTYGLKMGEEIIDTGEQLCIELGPGLLSSIFDGVQRPLAEIAGQYKSFIPTGVAMPALNRSRRWHFIPMVNPGDAVEEGNIIGTIQETTSIIHKVMVPPGIRGIIKDIAEADLLIEDKVSILENGRDIRLIQRWPVRRPRPFKRKITSRTPFTRRPSWWLSRAGMNTSVNG